MIVCVCPCCHGSFVGIMLLSHAAFLLLLEVLSNFSVAKTLSTKGSHDTRQNKRSVHISKIDLLPKGSKRT